MRQVITSPKEAQCHEPTDKCHQNRTEICQQHFTEIPTCLAAQAMNRPHTGNWPRKGEGGRGEVGVSHMFH